MVLLAAMQLERKNGRAEERYATERKRGREGQTNKQIEKNKLNIGKE